jgi:hypothetical protein
MEKYDIADAYLSMVSGKDQLNESADGTEVVHTIACKESLVEHNSIMSSYNEVLKEEFEETQSGGSVADLEKLVQIKKLADEKGLDIDAIADFMSAYTTGGDAGAEGDVAPEDGEGDVLDDLEGGDAEGDVLDDTEGADAPEGVEGDEAPDAEDDLEEDGSGETKWWEANDAVQEDEVELSDGGEGSESDEVLNADAEEDLGALADEGDLEEGDEDLGDDDSEGLDLGDDEGSDEGDLEGSDDSDLGDDLEGGDDEGSDEPAIVASLRAIESEGVVPDPSTGEEVSVSEQDAEKYVSVYEYLSSENQAKLVDLSLSDALELVGSIDLPEDGEDSDDLEGDDDSEDSDSVDLDGSDDAEGEDEEDELEL